MGCDARERKKALLTAIQALDFRADAVGLSPDEWLSRYDLEDQLSVIYTDEEAYMTSGFITFQKVWKKMTGRPSVSLIESWSSTRSFTRSGPSALGRSF